MTAFQQIPQLFTNMNNWRSSQASSVPLMPVNPRRMELEGNEINEDENHRWSTAPTVAQGMQFYHIEQVIAEVYYRPMSVDGFPKQYMPDLAATYISLIQTCISCPRNLSKRPCKACVIYAFERKFQLRKILDHSVMYRKWIEILKEADERADRNPSIQLVDLYVRLVWLGERKAWIESEIQHYLAVEEKLEGQQRLTLEATEEQEWRGKADIAERLEIRKVRDRKVAKLYLRELGLHRDGY